ncbi:protein ABHD11-like [Scaptodrosophila lebanonensis]|uniref:sn-1-specific diacylglycerol lipase ABHD11 n=1 Tax=Drosophila lebanonensis TaxID=7225 RepID=A0A6J2TLL3_DROLE|nr:protein ABHD11-like [Scaptodrosophila lebanonensis]
MLKYWSWLQCRRFGSLVPVAMNYALWQAASVADASIPIFIMHGLLGNMDNFRSIAMALAAQGTRNVFTMDMRNHGGSPHTNEHSSLHMASDVAALMYGHGVRQIIGVGHSSGGRVMMTLALTQPQLVHRLIISDISPITLPSNMHKMTRVFQTMLSISIPTELTLGQARQLIKPDLDKVTGDERSSQLILTNLTKLPSGEFHWRVNVQAILNNWMDFTHYHDTIMGLPPYMGPTLFLAGQHSAFVQPDDEPQIRQFFPNMQLQWMQSGHLIHMEQPQEFLNLVLQFSH